MILDKIRQRQKSLEISTDDIAELLSVETCMVQKHFESGKCSEKNIEKIVSLLGLDAFGNELADIDVILARRAKQKALYIVIRLQYPVQRIYDVNINSKPRIKICREVERLPFINLNLNKQL